MIKTLLIWRKNCECLLNKKLPTWTSLHGCLCLVSFLSRFMAIPRTLSKETGVDSRLSPHKINILLYGLCWVVLQNVITYWYRCQYNVFIFALHVFLPLLHNYICCPCLRGDKLFLFIIKQHVKIYHNMKYINFKILSLNLSSTTKSHWPCLHITVVLAFFQCSDTNPINVSL